MEFSDMSLEQLQEEKDAQLAVIHEYEGYLSQVLSELAGRIAIPADAAA